MAGGDSTTLIVGVVGSLVVTALACAVAAFVFRCREPVRGALQNLFRYRCPDALALDTALANTSRPSSTKATSVPKRRQTTTKAPARPKHAPPRPTTRAGTK